MPWRTLLRGILAPAILLALVLVTPVLWLGIDEGGVPSSYVPPLPAGVTVEREEVLCGSGGCWRQLELSGPVADPEPLLPQGVGVQHEVCRPLGLLDRRQVCSHLGGPRLLIVQFDRSAWFTR